MSPASSDLPANGTYHTYGNGTRVSNGNGVVNGYSNMVNGDGPTHLPNGSTNGNHTHTSHPQYDVTRQSRTSAPLAICGMACRLPGGLHNPQQLWDFLVAGGDARSRVPESRYKVSNFYSTTGKTGVMNTEYGYFLDESIDLGHLDASLFKIPRAELERTDPHQRQLMEVSRECFEDAGEVNWQGKTIGCYVGTMGDDWNQMYAKDNQQYGVYRAGGFSDFMLANRLSYELNLRGPSMHIRTACSSSLVALNDACEAIGRGDCEAALVAGANLMMCPDAPLAMKEQGVLSPDGSSNAFSADANGYARAEAINAVFVKPLADAIRDGNSIRAIIRGTASNSDGTTPNLTMPGAETHEAMIRRAYAKAGITDFSETGFFECHGTGTQTGDPIETTAVGRVFGKSGMTIGSIKPNLGHGEGASGLTSLIKTVMALENRVIPPNIKLGTPNKKIPFDLYKLTVPLEPTPWPANRLERASVNSFGIGGSNAHVILESPRNYNITSSPKTASSQPELLVYSAASQKSLQKMTSNIEKYAEENPEKLHDFAYTLANKRERFTHRAFMVTRPNSVPAASSTGKAGQVPNLVMVFTGQGAQWPQMGRELIESDKVFQDSIRSLDKFVQEMPDAPTWNIEEELLKPPKTSLLNTAEMSQPLCTALQIALVDYLTSVGVEPSMVVGHSSGEIAAAYAAGGLTKKEAITAAVHRGKITLRQQKQGLMAAIGMSREKTEKFLVHGVVVACENSPESVTISGDHDKLKIVVADIQKAYPDVLARLLKVDKAYHSHHMVEVGAEYYQMMEDTVIGRRPNKLFFSSVTGKLLTKADSLGAEYWQKNLQQCVLFKGAVESILQHPLGSNVAFLEIGPHSALAGPLRQTLAHSKINAPYTATITRNQDSAVTILSAIGQLYLWDLSVDFKALQPNGTSLYGLPTYPWNHDKSYWYESRLTKEWRFPKFRYHDLLGYRNSESTDFEPVWRNMLHMDNVPWVRDHKINDDIIFPFAGYVAIAGEAVRQINEAEEGFALRNVVVGAALLLTEGNAKEVVTSLRRHRLTNELDSEWWEFSIASHNGTVWTKHCTGQVRREDNTPSVSRNSTSLSRNVKSTTWYETMRRSGLNYGPRFQGLTDIHTSASEQVARATILESPETDKMNFHIHPTVTDFFLQLLSAAKSKGLSRNLQTLTVPTNIEEITVQRCHSEVEMTTSATTNDKGAIIGQGECFADGKCVLKMSGVKLSVLEGNDQGSRSDTYPTARLEWQPDVELVEPKELLKPSIDRKSYASLLDELTQLCVKSTQLSLDGSESMLPHMEKFRSWVDSYAEQSTIGDMSQSELSSKISDIVDNLSGTPAAVVATAMRGILDNIIDINEDEMEPLEVLLEDDMLTQLYGFVNECDRSSFIRLLAHKKPTLRVLELGAGTSGATESIMKELAPANDLPMYSKYVLSDISSGFFIEAKERFKSLPNMEYTALDISKDPKEQGFEYGQFDLVIATNSLHSTPNLKETLTHVRQLLHSDGKLLLQELVPSSKWINYVLGTLPEWWLGENDNRPNEPYVSPERWQSELTAAGFDTLEATEFDAEEPYQLNAMMIAKPQQEVTASKAVTLLCNHNSVESDKIVSVLQNRGYDVSICQPSSATSPKRDVLALLDIDHPFFENIDSTSYGWFQSFVASLDGSGVMWVTHASQMKSKDPRFAQILGAARSIRSELAADFATCEVDNIESSAERIVDVFSQFHTRKEEVAFTPEYEYVINDGTVSVGRYHPFSIEDKLVATESSDKVMLEVGKFGRLDSLYWSQQALPSLESDSVEVETYSVGLNLRDVHAAMGTVETPKAGLSLEAAGVVRKVGPEVKDLKVGDRVMAFETGTLGTMFSTTETLLQKIPDTLSFELAATIPCAYLTAIYCLMEIGRLANAQSILIHGACGAVGIAAMRIARMIGANVYATVGSAEKRQYLKDTFGIPDNKIFSSRDVSFLDGVMHETQGKGVDLVLNSLSGELLHASWRCVAEFGRMVEIGKRDLQGSGKLDLDVFLANRSYSCFDLVEMREKRPEVVSKLLQSAANYLEQGYIQPVQPVKTFGAAAVQDAFRYMQEGSHIGKIVVSIRDSPKHTNLTTAGLKKQVSLKLNGSASYLLIGGLGGLGRAISTWMVEQGARHLIYLSRSAGTKAEDMSFFEELNSSGCTVQVVKGSVSNAEDVQRAVQEAQKPLRGILQMSMVLRDRNFSQMTFDEWTAAVAPKVQGTWNLHNATVDAGVPLDFFVLFSSISGAIGQPGQANYASANTFLDAFVQYRLGQNLAISAIDIGAVEDVGYIADNDDGLWTRMKAAGAYGIRELELLQALTLAMQPFSSSMADASTGSKAYIAPNNFILGLTSTLPLSHSSNRALWKRDLRMAAYHNTASSSGAEESASNDKLKSFIASSKSNPDSSILASSETAAFLAQEIGKKLFEILLRDVEDDEILDAAKPLGDLGMDSLIAIELRSWWKQVFGFDVSVLEMLGAGTLGKLGKLAGDGLANGGGK